jgi:hypothetical protein
MGFARPGFRPAIRHLQQKETIDPAVTVTYTSIAPRGARFPTEVPAHMQKLTVVVATLLFTCTLLAGPIGPTSLTGDEIVALGGVVDLYFVGQTAGFDSVLNLISPVSIGPFFHNHLTAPGTMFTLGTFTAGTPLVFRMNVLTTGQQFSSGPATRNPDGIVHVGLSQWAADSFIPVDGLMVGFEDILGGGDLDFDDNVFVFANVGGGPVPPPPPPPTGTPEPSTLGLMASSLVVVTVLRKKLRSGGSV